jgi:hypothetical protein
LRACSTGLVTQRKRGEKHPKSSGRPDRRSIRHLSDVEPASYRVQAGALALATIEKLQPLESRDDRAAVGGRILALARQS